MQAKLLFKRLCSVKSGWDDEVSPDILADWKSLLKGLANVRSMSISRHVFFSQGCVKSIELHGFCDSSGKAYGCAVYVRIITNTSFNVKLWTVKSRLAPIKENSIPRLELMSCLLLATLMGSVLRAFGRSCLV